MSNILLYVPKSKYHATDTSWKVSHTVWHINTVQKHLFFSQFSALKDLTLIKAHHLIVYPFIIYWLVKQFNQILERVKFLYEQVNMRKKSFFSCIKVKFISIFKVQNMEVKGRSSWTFHQVLVPINLKQKYLL